MRSSLDPGDYLAVNNVVNLTNMTKQVTFRYAGGANGVAVGTDRAYVEIRLDSPTGPIAQTVTLKSTGTNNNTYTSQTFPLDFAGSHRVYFVFRTVPGGPATGFGNINWVEFSGAGIALPTDTAPVDDGLVRPAAVGLWRNLHRGHEAVARDPVGERRRRSRARPSTGSTAVRGRRTARRSGST